MRRGTEGRRPISRREFMALSAAGLAGLVATACGGGELPSPVSSPQAPGPTPGAAGPAPATQPTPAPQGPAPPPQAPAAAPATRKEAPQLAALVREGKLPPVEGRLPKNALVVKPLERTGKYGGQWRTGLLAAADAAWLIRTIGYEHLVRVDPEWKGVIPNVAESFEVSPDAKEYTFKLREGLRWSDGEPYTADDVVFWYEDVHLNKDLTPNRGINPPSVEKVDGYTFKAKFATPNGLLLQIMAGGFNGHEYVRYPKHYLQQFHIKYNPENVERLARENGVDGWVRLFQTKGGAIPGTPYDARWSNKDLPTLHPWRIVEPYGGGSRVVAERNPYYFKIDPEGNQLPYLDRVTYDVVQDKEVLVLKALNGEIDMMDRHIGTLNNKAVFTDNQQKSGYHFFDIVPSEMNNMVVFLNLTTKNPVLREVFRNKDFRVGLSHAINRQELLDVIYVGQGEPWQAAPRRETPFYSERLAKQYTEHDPAKANESLDKAGYSRKDGEGFRLGPDGKRISFVVETTTAIDPTWPDAMELIRQQWRRVGVDAQIKVQERSLLNTRTGANEHDCYVWKGDAGLKDAFQNPDRYVPIDQGGSIAPAWAVWFHNPSGAGARTPPEEPPAEVKRQMDVYRELQATFDEGKQTELMKQILEIAADQFYCIGTTLMANSYGIVKNNFKNVPEKMFGSGGPYINPGPTNPSQYFIDG